MQSALGSIGLLLVAWQCDDLHGLYIAASCVRHRATARCRSGGSGGPRPRLRRRRAGPSSSRAGGRGNVAGGGAGFRPPPRARVYGVGIPADRRPIFGPWLFRDVKPSLQLAGVLSPRAFRALATRAIRTAGGTRTPLVSGRKSCGGGRRRRSSTMVTRSFHHSDSEFYSDRLPLTVIVTDSP